MVAIVVKSFGGISPKVPARYLSDGQAQTATNCGVFSGSIQPLAAPGDSLLTLPKAGTPKTIYRFGQDISSDTQYWFHWLTDVDVCRSQIAGDASEWTFYTGDGAPKATYAAIATAGSDYPAAYRRLGLPAPTTAASVAVVGGADPTQTPESRVYTYTFVSKESGLTVESAPAPASAVVDVDTTQSVDLSAMDPAPSGDYNVTHRRIYRSVSGTYLFVAEVAIADTTYNDAVAAESLGESLPSTYWAQPPDDLAGLINLPNGMMAGFVGRDVYFSEPYHPYAWPASYVQTVDYPVVALGRMDTTLVVLTTGVPYLMQGSSPDAIAVVKSDLEQACASKRSVVSLGGTVLYASPDGLIALSSSGSRNLTADLFTRAQWQSQFLPESIHAYHHDNRYVAFYDNGTTSGGFVVDLSNGQFSTNDVYVEAGFNDIQRDKLFLANSDREVRVWADGSDKTYTWKSKVFTMPQTTGFSCCQVEAEQYPVIVRVYADGALFHAQTVQSRDPFRLPPGVGRDWEVELEGTYEVFSVALATSMTELAGG